MEIIHISKYFYVQIILNKQSSEMGMQKRCFKSFDAIESFDPR